MEKIRHPSELHISARQSLALGPDESSRYYLNIVTPDSRMGSVSVRLIPSVGTEGAFSPAARNKFPVD